MLELSSGGEYMEIKPESEAWFAWLDSAFSFVFDDPIGRFTARKKRRRSRAYWYAFRRRDGQFHEIYLGKAGNVTLGRLRAVAVRLNSLTRQRPRTRTATTAGAQAAQEVGASLSVARASWASLGAPPVRTPLVHTRAVDQLQRAMTSALTIVSGPVGYGKTTLLAQWIATSSLPAAWVTLDESDNDPARFWGHVAAAIAQVMPGLQKTVAKGGGATYPAILDLLGKIPFPLALALDDYHEIGSDNAVIHRAVTKLIEHLPPNVHLVLASRTIPPLPIANLRAQHRLIELHAADLLFTLEETRLFLKNLMHLNLSDEEVAILHERTEGWVAGLQFAALSLREQTDSRSWIAEFGGENRHIFDYLIEQVVNRLPADAQAFVLQTAILDRLSGPLADAVTQSGSGQAMLEELERANLFLAPLDDRREWYRFHHLFRDVLRRYVQQTQRGALRERCVRASEWCEANGLTLDAIDYAYAANEPQRAARLLAAYAPIAFAKGDVVALLDRLERLPGAILRARPRLCVAHAYALYVSGERTRWLRCVRDAEESLARTAHLFDAAELAILEGELLALRGIARYQLGEGAPRELIAWFQRALGALPLTHAFRPIITLYIGICQLADGDARAASRTLDVLVRASEARADVFYFCVSMLYLSLALLLQGRLDDTLDLCTRAERYLAGYDDADLEARVHMIRAKVYYERNEQARALECLRRGISLQYDATPFLSEGYPTLANVYQAQGNFAAAQHIMEQSLAEWAALLSENKTLWVWTGRLIQAHQARVWLLGGNGEAATAWARDLQQGKALQPEGRSGPPSYMQEWEDLVLARAYLAEQRAHDALALLATLRGAAEAQGRVARELEMLILQAVAQEALGDTSSALRSLRSAVELGAHQRFVRTFVDGGPVTHRLLRLLHTQRAQPGAHQLRRRDVAYVENLLAAFAPAGSSDTARSADRSAMRVSSAQIEERPVERRAPKLTPREREVIRLIADGLANADIARALWISPFTAKRHVSNILTALGVRNRTEAVARARELHFLDVESAPGDSETYGSAPEGR